MENIDLQDLSSSEDIVFNRTQGEQHEFGFLKRKQYALLSYLRQHYLRVFKILCYIILSLVVILIAVFVYIGVGLKSETNPSEKPRHVPAHHVSAYLPVKSVELQLPTESSTFEIPRPPKDWTFEQREKYISEYIKQHLNRPASGAPGQEDHRIAGQNLEALPSKLKLCRSVECAKQKEFQINVISVDQLKTYGCCKSPPSVTFEAVSKTEERYDLIYSSDEIKFVDFLPELVNLTGSWAEGSFNEQKVYVYRGVGLKPPDPEE